MDSREANLPADHSHDSNLYRSFNATTSSSSSSFNSSPPDFLRNVQAAFKRHRMMPQVNNLQPRRLVVPRRETSKSSGPILDSKADESHDDSLKQRLQDSSAQTKNMMTLTTVDHDFASITPPPVSGTPREEGKFQSIDTQRGQPNFSCDCRSSNMVDLPCCKTCENNLLVDGPKKVQFASDNTARSHDNKSTKGEHFAGDIIDLPSQPPILNDQTSNVKSVSSKPGKNEKQVSKKDVAAARKKNHDQDLFFKVNGKHYQRLGKIGSGGSSDVHKVISQDCTIYALKKIKLKGRDYATAYGFCQEIEYLNKLKGKDHIIQLIDYEVTDKALLKEVMSGSMRTMSNKDGIVKEDGCIYMVLEYGEIDLAHMLSQKWKELDSSRLTIDENWLRFYWQQILLAVKTIHEERIVHSDLKPANFLLVRGSLKLIDFGIAKAILSDTTNIQRDSQVGTLSYMSPEAFMCNETDANGNIIKCGRPSDIWSLGCILYQMVYGRTPFADYTTFWAKFKVITDPNHEIQYEPLPNPWLLDLMKKCLSWDRKGRWTIPQLLQHPFLVPPIPHHLSTGQHNHRSLIQLIADSCSEDPKATMLCARLQQLVSDPLPDFTSVGSISLGQRCTLLDEMSNLCLQLKEQLANLKI